MKNFWKRVIRKAKNRRLASFDKTSKLFSLLPNGLTLLDIGAAGGIEPRWEKVCKSLNYIGVEPDKRTNKELYVESKARNTYILEKFAWDSDTEVEFNLCRKAHVSSVYTPNRELLNLFFDSERFDILKTEKVKASRLEVELKEHKVDFIKLDIQGGELNALKGIGDNLRNCLGVEVEVEFSDIYISPTLFSKVYEFLRNQGFYFCDFFRLSRWERRSRGYGRCMFGNGLWLREIDSIAIQNDDEYLKYSAICALYGKTDEAIACMNLIKEKSRKHHKEFAIVLASERRQQEKTRNIFKALSRLWEIYSPITNIHLEE